MEENKSDLENQNSLEYLLSYNINLLSSYPITHYNSMYNEINKLKEDNERLKKMNKNLLRDNEKKDEETRLIRRKLNNSDKLLEELKRKRSRPDENDNQNIEEIFGSKYQIFNYRVNKSSYSDEKVSEIIKSIKGIEDIIQLKDKWVNIKHNENLQRFHNLIPALEKLNSMIGLKQIKDDVFMKIIYYIKNPSNEEYLHTQISGPPGVGKTEFAKIYADIFVRLGILKSDKFIEIKRDDLVGKYLGQTAPKTRELLEKAMGGVLFLDEAYSLGNEEKRDSFSKESIDMINQYLSERKNDFMFIIAGYEEDCEKCFFAYNKGLKRRFSSHYRIEGYDSTELNNIFKGKINKKYKLNISDKELISFFEKNKDCFIHFGGDIEKLYNEIKYVQCFRTFNESSESTEIIINDLNKALENIRSKKTKESNPPLNMYL